MSFYVYGTHNQSSQPLTTVVTLAVDGKIDEALRKWQVHMVSLNRCGCGSEHFDPVSCGYCLTGKLLYLELLQADTAKGVDCLETARAISAVSTYVGKIRAIAQGAQENELCVTPRPAAAPEVESRT